MFFVTATERDHVCDPRSPIRRLKLSPNYNGTGLHLIQGLKPLADAGLLWVKRGHLTEPAKVRIFHTPWRCIATTNPDGTICNNLLSLPIWYPTGADDQVIHFAACPV